MRSIRGEEFGWLNTPYHEGWAAVPDEEVLWATVEPVLVWAAEQVSPCRIGDVGCGASRAGRWMAARWPDATVVSVDMQDYGLGHPGEFVRQDAHLPLPGKPYDLVWASHVLEHLASPLSALWSWRCSLAPDGWLCVVVPTDWRVVPGHLWDLHDPHRLAYLLRAAGFRVAAARWMKHTYSLAALVQPGPVEQDGLPDEPVVEEVG